MSLGFANPLVVGHCWCRCLFEVVALLVQAGSQQQMNSVLFFDAFFDLFDAWLIPFGFLVPIFSKFVYFTIITMLK